MTRGKSPKRSGCSCEKCIEGCKREPGWFLPEEVPIAAKFMGLSEQEFITKYCEDHLEDGILAISPARKPGKTECIFLDHKNLCKIHDAKPHECRKVYGCGQESRHRNIRDNIKKQWR